MGRSTINGREQGGRPEIRSGQVNGASAVPVIEWDGSSVETRDPYRNPKRLGFESTASPTRKLSGGIA